MWPVVQFYSSDIFSPSTVSVGIWIPSSVSTPQVGFVWQRASPIQERSKSQGRRRPLEVWCSGVPLGSLAGFEMALGSVRSTPWSENRKELKRLLQMCHQCLRNSLIANWFKS